MLVVFRADASVEIGTGHMMRCLTLADELRHQGHQCCFICRDHEGHLGELIVRKGYELHLLPGSRRAGDQPEEAANNPHAAWLGVSWQQDAEQTLEVLSAMEADWQVVDHYALDADWERCVAESVDRILVIDDLADRDHECSVLLDQNLGRVASDYDQRVSADCLRLIGPTFSLLRPEFARLRGQSLERRQDPEVRRILVSLGGVDRDNVTGRVLDALKETSLPPETELDIIMGASAPHLAEVQVQAAEMPFRATVQVNVSDMAERMCLADLSIGAAGGTSWERCCLGLPALLVVLADNQVSGAAALERAGAARVIAGPDSLQAELPSALAGMSEPATLMRMSHAAAQVTAGEGARLVVDSMVTIAGGGQ
ncbi:UDP-2,4-diacetamido-2,4,6-trideoxy-beta-L-altropyranose hydrolase [Marinobacter pelagius]|uniref:UDP-2,4-diacetamido-2,4, 6-trideoxy-beta-L-altropyranose hydrolase n=1 Tax=Marinobacter sp. C7 TaxID=2951363 RepID=UPI001EEF910A|nr:UDP-2,4-diacetamido-2,4,6-trideoxy-beta-L-altropyranose hydrolase [Marinobacter sp. C7]